MPDEDVSTAEDTRKLGIEVGDFVCFDPRTRRTASGYLKSRFLDDKLSVGILLGFAKYLADNRITLHATERDQYGLPVPVVTKTPHNNDHAMTADACNVTGEIYDAVGAKAIYNLPAYPASHNMGTNRMSADPTRGVVNAQGQSHDVANLFVSDGSQFTSSSAANCSVPTTPRSTPSMTTGTSSRASRPTTSSPASG